MFCPNITNKQVLQEFNEIVEALGGTPMTIEEFKDKELRSRRSGRDRDAMVIAYRIWDKNKGNAIDYAPNGALSKLFSDLLKITGSRKKAIIAKSKTYSDAFIDWFGDWISDNKEGVSKVVDENGEPLIVYHGGSKQLTVFEKNHKSLDGGFYGLGTYFTNNKDYAESYGSNIHIVFLNIKNPKIISADDESMLEKEIKGNDGVIAEFSQISDNMDWKEYVVPESNQIKSATKNKGSYSKNKDNIYALKSVVSDFEQFNIEELLGESLTEQLNSDGVISSKDLVQRLLDQKLIKHSETKLAELLLSFDVPVFIDTVSDPSNIAETIVDEEGNSIIVLNKDLINTVSKQYASTALLHELIHSVTVGALTNPKSKEDKELSKNTKKIFSTFKKLVPNYPYIADTESGLYAFLNRKEFVSVFMTDKNVRLLLMQITKQSDSENSLLNIFKNFVNSIAKFFTQKEVFKSNLKKAEEYYNFVLDYINNKRIDNKYKKGDIIRLYKEANRSINGELDFNESVIDFFKRTQLFDKSLTTNALKLNNVAEIINNKLHIGSRKTDEKKKTEQQYNAIVDMLKTRLKALRSSDHSVKDKERLIIETSDQIESFTNDYISKYNAISGLVVLTAAQLHSDLNDLRQRYYNDENFSGEEYMYQAHGNFGMYRKLTETFTIILEDEDSISQILLQYNKDKKDSEKLLMSDIEELRLNIKTINSLCLDALAILGNIKEKITLKSLSNIRNQTGAFDLDPILTRIASGDPILDEDISIFEVYGGAADSSSSPIIRSLAYLLGKAKDNAENESLEAMDPLLDASQGLDVSKIYERHENKLTGYFMRRLNYGKFYSDYDKTMTEINRKISKKYNIVLSDDNRIAPHLEKARVEWHSLRNNWLNKHAERRYNSKYYEAWSKVPEIARLAMLSYNNEINTILKNPNYNILYDDNGVTKTRVAYEKISDEDWTRLQHLWILKKNLRSDIDIYGNKKEGELAEIAKALRQLDIDLGYVDEKKRQPIKNKKAWLDARNKEIEECGGQEAKSKWEAGEKDHGFDSKRFEQWEYRNTIKILKKDSTGEALVFKKIREIMRGVQIDYGEEYESLKEEANQLLKDFRDQRGEVIADELPLSIRNRLIEIYDRQYKIREEKKLDDSIAKLQQLQKELYDIYIKYVDTEYYKALQKKAWEMVDDEEDDFYAEDDYLAYLYDMGCGYLGEDELGDLYIKPHRWLLKIESTKPEFMDYEPGNAWIQHDDNEMYINKEFERLSQISGNENVSMIPKESLYKNDEFEKLMKDDRYKKLYQETIKLNNKANKKQKNRQYTDDYLVPQITGTLSDRIANAPGILHKVGTIWNWLMEKLGINKNTDDQAILGDTSIDQSSNEDLIFEKHKNSLRGKYPDGRPFNIIPLFYTRRLKDPSIISTDLLNIMHQYYLMSASYEQKQKIKGECETILDQISDKSYSDSGNNTIIGGQTTSESNTYKMARKFLEMNLYNVKRTSRSIPFFGTKWEYTKSIELWKEYATARNLGANPKVAVVGCLTSSYVHLINMIVGSLPGIAGKYNFRTGCKAFTEVLFKVGLKGVSYISNNNSDDKMMKIMEFSDLANQASRKFKYSNRNRITGAISKNYVYGFMSTLDFFIKSQIALSETMSYRYVDGEFITISDIHYNRTVYGEDVYKDKINKYKNAEGLYSLLKVENGKLVIDDKYKKAFNDIKNVLRNRILKTAENADGMATTLQRNAMTQNIILALVLMHRQYLPLMIQEAYGKQVYDYDAQRYKNGQIRSLFGLTKELMMNNMLAGVISGGVLGYAFGGIIGGTIGSALGVYIRSRYGIRQEHAGKKQKKSFKDVINKRFSDFSNIESTHKSYANREAVFKTTVEILLFNLLTAPVINLICKTYDDDDNLLIQFLLYCLRAFQWEAYTKYRTAEIFNNVRTATAATSITDGLVEFGLNMNNTIQNTLFPRGSVFDPIKDVTDTNITDTSIQSGVYEGRSPVTRTVVKSTPWHNLLEQVLDSKHKREYQETQIQKLPKDLR